MPYLVILLYLTLYVFPHRATLLRGREAIADLLLGADRSARAHPHPRGTALAIHHVV